MASVLEMPKLTDTMTEGVITRWLVHEEEAVSSGEELLEIETDKANVTYDSFENGYLAKILVPDGKAAALGQPIAIISEDKDEDISSLLRDLEKKLESPEKKEADELPKISPEPLKTPGALPEELSQPVETKRICISPIAKKMIEKKGIEVSRVKGTGPHGRIIKRDILNYLEQARPETKVTEYKDIPLSMLRKTIAGRMKEAKTSIPHYYLTLSCNLQLLSEMRKGFNETLPKEEKVGFNSLFIKIAAVALLKYPVVNSSYQGNFIRQYHTANISVAVAIEKGLVVPTLFHAEKKGLKQIGKEVKELAQKARAGKLEPDEMAGGTFCISNLGMYDIEEFSAIINPPQAAILALGKVEEVPAVIRGEVKIVPKMKATLSCDHRVIDGKEGAEFLSYFKYLTENPLGMVY